MCRVSSFFDKTGYLSACSSAKKVFFRPQIEGVKMTRQEILKEKETISSMIFMMLGNIQKKNKLNRLANLLVRQAWLSSEIKEEVRIC